MQITVKTFAQTREITGEAHLTLEVREGVSVAALVDDLRIRNDKWALALEGNVLTARNQQLCDCDTAIEEGDEIALFPPVTGG